MCFLLTTLKVTYILDTPRPSEEDGEESMERTRSRQKWDNDDYICMGHILNGMSNALFDAYQNKASAKQLWDKLEARYMAEDASSKKFLVSRFNNYKMVDNHSIMEQLHELERILNSFKQYGLKMDEAIVVSSIIDKLPPSWRDTKKFLKHEKEEMSLEDLSNHVRIEEDYRKQEEVNDRGGEYYDPKYFEFTGIIHETTAPYTPEQNGVAERKNQVLTEMVNALLSNS
ncbi:PREDICTED: uncharacterized protein LOC108663940, partial [Theobroma cacao]|uniref:Uncharacterized protein LOC108663940 n=1 Tax=Theobroma cacao TaxID=3641 RepID=A0AB32X164_THECC